MNLNKGYPFASSCLFQNPIGLGRTAPTCTTSKRTKQDGNLPVYSLVFYTPRVSLFMELGGGDINRISIQSLSSPWEISIFCCWEDRSRLKISVNIWLPTNLYFGVNARFLA